MQCQNESKYRFCYLITVKLGKKKLELQSITFFEEIIQKPITEFLEELIQRQLMQDT